MATVSTAAADMPESTAAELIAQRPHLTMHAMDGLLIDDVPLNAIADAVGTPTWVYSASAMRGRYRSLTAALADAGLDAHVHYAVKANDQLAVLRRVRPPKARAPMWSAKANCAVRARPASRPIASCSPASAKPRANCVWR